MHHDVTLFAKKFKQTKISEVGGKGLKTAKEVSIQF